MSCPVDLEALQEAAALEREGGRWTARHVAAVLGISRATVYRTRWLLALRKRSSEGTVRWEPREVRIREALREGKDPSVTRRAVGM